VGHSIREHEKYDGVGRVKPGEIFSVQKGTPGGNLRGQDFDGVYQEGHAFLRNCGTVEYAFPQAKGEVWDIYNAGPRRRFTVNGRLVHNCIILDHSDNHARLGFVTDIRHDRLNTGEKAKAGEAQPRDEPLPKECSKCNFVKPPKVLECPNCGFKPERQSDIEPEEGELVEVKAKKVATMEDKQAFYSGLLAIQRQRGKKQGWVAHTYREKFGVWPRGMYAIEATPSAEVVAFVQHKAIKYAKRRSA
jgi:hypothetical protein